MNCEVTNLPVLEVENHQIREVLRCILHTILFSRALGLVQPKDVDSELFNITYVQCGERDLERKVEERINCFCDWVDKHPGVKRGEVCISFYEKRYKQIWFSKQEERLYWEQWRIHLDITRMDASRGGNFDQRAGGELGAAQAALERDLESALTFILQVVNEKKDHIPPVTCSDVLSFPYEITIPGEGDSSFGKNLMKRMMEVSPPPMLGDELFEPSLASVLLAKTISLLGGAGAGMTAKLLTHPMDTIKARLQVQRQGGVAGPLYTGTLDAAVKVAKAEGLGGFYRGFGAVVIFQVPGAAAYFGGYELGKSVMPDTALGHAGVGVMAQSVAGLVFTPQDVVKERLQVQAVLQQQDGAGYGYRGSVHALKTIVAKEGLLGPFRGYWLTNAAWVPWSILHVAIYERLKGAAARGLGADHAEDLPGPAIAACAMASAGSAALMTNPVDVVKTRYQTARQHGGEVGGRALALKVWAEEGVQGLWRGASARVLTIAPGTALSWLLYEEFKRAMALP